MAKSARTDEEAHHHRQIRDANEKIIAATALLEVRVIRAREDGISWNVIADAVGTARQSATGRFGRLIEMEQANGA